MLLDDGAQRDLGLIIVDVSARHAAEARERALRKRLDRIMNGMARLVLFSIDVELAVVEVTDGLAELIGWTRGSPPRELAALLALVHPTDRIELERRLTRAIENRGALEYEFRVYADLGERWLRISGSVVDEPLRIVGSGMDVTDRRALEKQVLEVSEQLQRQIGQDLHDGLGQLLTGTAFLAKGLVDYVDDEYAAQANRVVELINQAITRVRSLARGLSPIHVEAKSLVTVLRDVVSESGKLLGVECIFDHHDDVESDEPATIMQLCLIVREAITNAVRHGQARRIVVRLMREGERDVLCIEDNGIGISSSPATQEGLGLRSMRHRASAIGGSLEVCRGDVGTVVRCSFGG
jgi:signal transduction histidine kinase